MTNPFQTVSDRSYVVIDLTPNLASGRAEDSILCDKNVAQSVTFLSQRSKRTILPQAKPAVVGVHL